MFDLASSGFMNRQSRESVAAVPKSIFTHQIFVDGELELTDPNLPSL